MSSSDDLTQSGYIARHSIDRDPYNPDHHARIVVYRVSGQYLDARTVTRHEAVESKAVAA